MKCNQCEMLQITCGGVSAPCHEIGCPNSHKVWDEDEQEWVTPERDEDFEDWWDEEEELDEQEWGTEDEPEDEEKN